MKNNELYNGIQSELKQFRFNRNSLGYVYLMDSIALVSENKTCIKSFKKFLYPIIAKKYSTTSDNVQWCLDKMIALMCFNTSQEIITKYFNYYYYKKPSTKEFIMGVAQKL